MAKNAPGKHYRKSISLIQALQEFGDDTLAEQWLVARRWKNGICCVNCMGKSITHRKTVRQTPQYHCTDCKANFTVKTGTVMHDSKLSLSKWALAFYLFNTNLKGVSSMKLHRDLGITQKTAWHLAHRIRSTWNKETMLMAGEAEADETYFGGKERNKHSNKKLRYGRGPVGKTAVVGIRDRETGRVAAKVVPSTDAATLQGFVLDKTGVHATVYTDEAAAYQGLARMHKTVRHSAKEYVHGRAHTNGIESFWAMLKRGHDGVYHHISTKHLHRYVTEFEGRHNVRPLDTVDQMTSMALGAVGKRLSYETLIGPTWSRQPRLF